MKIFPTTSSAATHRFRGARLRALPPRCGTLCALPVRGTRSSMRLAAAEYSMGSLSLLGRREAGKCARNRGERSGHFRRRPPNPSSGRPRLSSAPCRPPRRDRRPSRDSRARKMGGKAPPSMPAEIVSRQRNKIINQMNRRGERGKKSNSILLPTLKSLA